MITDAETPVVEGERKKGVGSILIIEAENIEEVRKLIENDIYTTSGVVSPVKADASTLPHMPLLSGTRRSWSLRRFLQQHHFLESREFVDTIL
jgi:hypothetical protein